MGKFSREKGKRGERLVVTYLKDKFPNCKNDLRRSVQSDGARESDVVGLPGFWVEVKKGPKPNMRAAINQACGDADAAHANKIPVAFILDDNGAWNVVMRADDWCVLARHMVDM